MPGHRGSSYAGAGRVSLLQFVGGSATVVGDYVVPSSAVSNGLYPFCHDAGGDAPYGNAWSWARAAGEFQAARRCRCFSTCRGRVLKGGGGVVFDSMVDNEYDGDGDQLFEYGEQSGVVGCELLTFPLATTQVTYDVSTARTTRATRI